MKEIWKDIPNANGIYQASTYKQLACKYNISIGSVGYIINRQHWKHI